MKLDFALFGAGRIGRLHAANLNGHPDARVSVIYDVDLVSARAAASHFGGRVAESVSEALASDVGAVLIASSTDTHVDLMTAAAQAGKPVFCEKPIDLDSVRVEQCWKAIRGHSPAIQIGFNRRYDPTHRALRKAVMAGELGSIEQIVITSRDPEPPPLEYIRRSGGLFRDMMIHDFDIARFLLPEEVEEVSAVASCLIQPDIGEQGDVDSAMVTLRTAGGVLCHINNSRRSIYGYDQRVEVFGSGGMMRSANPRPTAVLQSDATTTDAASPLYHFFTERYALSYRAELDAFIQAVLKKREPEVTFDDGRRALILADAAEESLRTGRRVRI